ncbi:hypothetical protein XENOCAPTIV_028329, partial [Xenoophorus captivus]
LPIGLDGLLHHFRPCPGPTSGSDPSPFGEMVTCQEEFGVFYLFIPGILHSILFPHREVGDETVLVGVGADHQLFNVQGCSLLESDEYCCDLCLLTCFRPQLVVVWFGDVVPNPDDTHTSL